MENSWSSAGPTTSGRTVWPQPVPPSAESHLIQPHSHLPRGHNYRATPEGCTPGHQKQPPLSLNRPLPPSREHIPGSTASRSRPHGSTPAQALRPHCFPEAAPVQGHSRRGARCPQGPSWCLINNNEKGETQTRNWACNVHPCGPGRGPSVDTRKHHGCPPPRLTDHLATRDLCAAGRGQIPQQPRTPRGGRAVPAPAGPRTGHLSRRAAPWEPTLEGVLLSFREQDLCKPRKGACEDKDRQQLAPKRD